MEPEIGEGIGTEAKCQGSDSSCLIREAERRKIPIEEHAGDDHLRNETDALKDQKPVARENQGNQEKRVKKIIEAIATDIVDA